jgi:hypothetical protein
MVSDSHDRTAALLDSARPGTSGPARRPVPRPRHVRSVRSGPRVEVRESEDTVVVRVPLCEGPVELRVPRTAVKTSKRPPRHHIEGFNPDATPC